MKTFQGERLRKSEIDYRGANSTVKTSNDRGYYQNDPISRIVNEVGYQVIPRSPKVLAFVYSVRTANYRQP